MGDKVETKSGKKGVITHVHKKSGYLFIHDPGEGKTYHVSWGSVTQINGKLAAEVAGKPAASDDPNRKADQPKEKPSSASQGATENYWQSPAGKAILETQSKPKGDVSGNAKQEPAWEALKSHGWSATKKHSDGAVTFSHPKMGNTFEVDADGTLINPNSGTKGQAGPGGRVHQGVPFKLREAGRGSRQAEGGRWIHAGGQAHSGHSQGRLN